MKKLKKSESFLSWITKILVFKSIDFIRKESRHFATDNDEIITELLANERRFDTPFSRFVRRLLKEI
nr:hypothetical protein [Psychrobacillus sp. OK028]